MEAKEERETETAASRIMSVCLSTRLNRSLNNLS